MMIIGRQTQSLLWLLLGAILTCDGVLITSAGAPTDATGNGSSLRHSSPLYNGPWIGYLPEGALVKSSLSAYTMPTPGETNLNMENLPSFSAKEQSSSASELALLLQRLKDAAAAAPSTADGNKLPYRPKSEGSPYDIKYMTASGGVSEQQPAATVVNAPLMADHTPSRVVKTDSPSTVRPTLVELLEQLEQRLSQDGYTKSSTSAPAQSQQHPTPGIPRNHRKRPEPSDSAPAPSVVPILASSSISPPWSSASLPNSPTTNLVFVISPEMATRTIRNLMGSISEELVPTNSADAATSIPPPAMPSPAPQLSLKPNSVTFKLNTHAQHPTQQPPVLPPTILPPSIPLSNEYLKETVLPYLASLATAHAAQAAIYPAAVAAMMSSAGSSGAISSAPFVDPVAVQLMASAQQHMNKHGWHNPSQHAMVNQFMSTITSAPPVDAGSQQQPGTPYTNFGAGLGVASASGIRVGGVADIGSFLSTLGINPPQNNNNAAALSGGGGAHAPGSISGLVALASAGQASTEQASK